MVPLHHLLTSLFSLLVLFHFFNSFLLLECTWENTLIKFFESFLSFFVVRKLLVLLSGTDLTLAFPTTSKHLKLLGIKLWQFWALSLSGECLFVVTWVNFNFILGFVPESHSLLGLNSFFSDLWRGEFLDLEVDSSSNCDGFGVRKHLWFKPGYRLTTPQMQ